MRTGQEYPHPLGQGSVLSCSCSPPGTQSCFIFAIRKLSSPHDYIQGTKSAPEESKQDPPRNTPSISQSSFFLQHILAMFVVERIQQAENHPTSTANVQCSSFDQTFVFPLPLLSIREVRSRKRPTVEQRRRVVRMSTFQLRSYWNGKPVKYLARQKRSN